MPKANSLDNFNIFELLGLSNISDQDKSDFLLQMESNIWSEFLILRLSKILTEEQLSDLNNLTEKNQNLEVATGYIKSKVPNFNELLFEFAREEKIKTIRNHIQLLLKTSQSLEETSKKTKKLQEALILVDQNKWQDLKNLWLNTQS